VAHEITGKFVILDRGEVRAFTRYDDIPAEIDTVIEFRPDIPPGPHSDEEHEFIESLVEKFTAIMRRSRGATSD
jgi:hypothetical protein